MGNTLKQYNDKGNQAMTIHKSIYGAYVISTLVKGYLVTRIYIGYTKRESIKLFNAEVN